MPVRTNGNITFDRLGVQFKDLIFFNINSSLCNYSTVYVEDLFFDLTVKDKGYAFKVQIQLHS